MAAPGYARSAIGGISMPQSLTTPSTSELLIQKSRFIGCVPPVADRTAAQQVAKLNEAMGRRADLRWTTQLRGCS